MRKTRFLCFGICPYEPGESLRRQFVLADDAEAQGATCFVVSSHQVEAIVQIDSRPGQQQI